MSKKILIVEDDEAILELLLEIFSELPEYIVSSAVDGQEAIDAARANNPDIILLDILLPTMSGYDVCRSVKSDTITSHIKVLILSGMAQNMDHKKALEVGADAYITKPFSSDLLLEKVGELLRES
jgi:DNA-binding response OmpR family regulator